jgi:MFS family permease
VADNVAAGAPAGEVWAKRILIAIVAIIALIGLGFLGASFLPRWWSHRIGGQVSGSISGGVALGLFYGFVFTALPLAVLWFAFSRRRRWKTWAILFGFAILLAAPNLLTLGIVLGSGSGAHAGDRTLDVEAPAFRSSSLAGAILALIAFALFLYLVGARRRAHHEIARLRAELKAKDAPAPPPPEPTA